MRIEDIDKELFHFEARNHTDIIKAIYVECQVKQSCENQLSILDNVNALYDYAEILNLKDILDYLEKFRLFLNIIYQQAIQLGADESKVIYTAADMVMLLSHKYIYDYELEIIHLEFLESTQKVFEKYITSYTLDESNLYKSEMPLNITANDKTILFVDDSLTVRKICEKMAITHGYKVQIATNGLHGYRLARNYKYDLIFSDINMPQMDGLDMVEFIRGLKEHRFTPIVMLTTERDKDMMDRAKSMGVKAWLVKPFKKEKLFGLVEKILMF
jgi:two-component system chemotaxis response regulator CheY